MATVGVYGLRRGPVHTDDPHGFAEMDLSRGTMPRAALGVAYANDPMWQRREFPAVDVAIPVVYMHTFFNNILYIIKHNLHRAYEAINT
jgi:hypothetical protein